MPRMNGVEATLVITAAQPEVAVLVLTMLEDDASLFAALEAAPGLPARGVGARRHVTDRAAAVALARDAGYGQRTV